MTSDNPEGGGDPGAASDPEEAKRRTVEQLNEFESKKAAARESLQSKLAAFRSTLGEEEQAALQKLLGPSEPLVRTSADNAVVSVHLKPMQVHEGPEVSVFLKPMQVHGGTEVSVFLKPMQIHQGPEVSVFLKPMQVHDEVEEAAYLKPMQVHEDSEQTAYLKPMQVHDE